MNTNNKTITLYPVTIQRFTEDCIYQPSRIRQPVDVPIVDFLHHFDSVPGWVCFEPVDSDKDLKEKAQYVLMWGYLGDCWYTLGCSPQDEAQIVAEIHHLVMTDQHRAKKLPSLFIEVK